MMVSAKEREVVQGRPPALLPGLDVMSLTVWFCHITAGECAATVAVGECVTQVARDGAGRPTQVEELGRATHDGRQDL